jgi:RNA polymerase sigma factor (sigma-70 family)
MLLGGSGVEAPAAASRPLPIPAAALRLLSDERLARLASAGDRAAFGVIFHRYHQELHRYCASILRNPEDAGDALQSTMLRALNALEGDTRQIALRPWLYRIAHNESITLVRRRRQTGLDGELSVPSRFDGEASADLRAQLHELLGDLRELPERQRGALVMRELGGLNYTEIAAVLDTTPAGAKQATYDARRALHELVKGREMDCAVVCSAISDGDGRAMRGRALRAHLRACADCRDFRSAITDRRSKLAELTPVMPAAAASGLLESVLASAGGGIGGPGLLTTGVLPAVGGGGGGGRDAAGGVREVSVLPSGTQAAPATSYAHGVSNGHRADRGQAGRGAAGGTGQNGGAHRPAHHPAPPSRPGGTRNTAAVATPLDTGDTSSAPSRPHCHRSSGGRSLSTAVTETSQQRPAQQAVAIVSHADLPGAAHVQEPLPVKSPPIPLHPKAMHGRHVERTWEKSATRS